MSSDLRARLPMTLFFSDVKQSGVQTAVALSERIEILLSSCNLKVFKFQFDKFYRNSICEKMEKKTGSTTGKYCSKLAFEWSHFRILSTDAKVGTTLYSIINSTTGKYGSIAFI